MLRLSIPKFFKSPFQNPNFATLNFKLTLQFRPMSSTSSSSSKVVAEYAKSGRSACKKCSQKITANVLRMGLINKGPGGFDMTSWHHLDCFPLDSESVSISSVDSIKGFESLKSNDQEAVKKFIGEGMQAVEKISDGEEAAFVGSKRTYLTEAKEPSDEEEEELGESNFKKQKISGGEEAIIVGSKRTSFTELKAKEPSDEDEEELGESNFKKQKSSSSKVVVEYAKSGRSTCKKCSQKIMANALRMGLINKGPGGFDMTSWHHLECFPLVSNSVSISSVDSINGFQSLKSDDQEALKKFIRGVQTLEKISGGEEAPIVGSKKKSSMEFKAKEPSDEEDKELGESNFKKQRLSEVEIKFTAADVMKKYKDAVLLPKWKAFQSIIFLEQDEGLRDSSKIAAFDFDGCLAKTHVNRVGADAWTLMYPSIPEKLQSLYNDGYKLVIFTNESNIERWKKSRQRAVDSKIGRLESFIKLVKVPIQVFIACGWSKSQPEDLFRKPKPGMWYLMKDHFNSGLQIDMDQSFYVGDAAGRENDHSDADIKFAQAVGLKFYVPEEFFIS